MERKITITMEGGLIQDIEHIPEDVVVEVLDFDAKDSSIDDDVCESLDCTVKDRHWHTLWMGGESGQMTKP